MECPCRSPYPHLPARSKSPRQRARWRAASMTVLTILCGRSPRCNRLPPPPPPPPGALSAIPINHSQQTFPATMLLLHHMLCCKIIPQLFHVNLGLIFDPARHPCRPYLLVKSPGSGGPSVQSYSTVLQYSTVGGCFTASTVPEAVPSSKQG